MLPPAPEVEHLVLPGDEIKEVLARPSAPAFFQAIPVEESSTQNTCGYGRRGRSLRAPPRSLSGSVAVGLSLSASSCSSSWPKKCWTETVQYEITLSDQ